MTDPTSSQRIELLAPQSLIHSFEQTANRRHCEINEIILEAMRDWLDREVQRLDIGSELSHLKDELRDQKDDLRDLRDDYRDLKDDLRELKQKRENS